MARIKPTDNTILYFIFGIIMLCIISSITSTTGGSYYVINEIDPYEKDFSNDNLKEGKKVLNYCQTRGVCFDGLIGWYDILSFTPGDYSWYDKSRQNNTLILNRVEKNYKLVLKKVKLFAINRDIPIQNLQQYEKDEKDRLNLSKEEIDILEKNLNIKIASTNIMDLQKRVTDVYDEMQQKDKDILYLKELVGASNNFAPDNEKITRYKILFSLTAWDISLLQSYKDKAQEKLKTMEKSLSSSGGKVTGTVSDTIEFPDEMFTKNDNYTFFHVSNYIYKGGRNKRIFQSSDINYLSGFHNGIAGVSFQGNVWVKSQGATGATGAIGYGSQHILSIEHKGEYAMNFEEFKKADGATVPKKVGVNVGKYPDEYSDFQISEILVYDRKLTESEIDVVRKYLGDMHDI